MHANEIHAHYDRHNKVSPSPKLSSPNTSKSVANNINILCLICAFLGTNGVIHIKCYTKHITNSFEVPQLLKIREDQIFHNN